MKQKRKIVRFTNWSGLIPQFALILFVTLIFQQLKVERYWLLSIAIYFLLSGYLKIIIPRSHRRGLYYTRKGEYEGAVYAFKRSYNFFSKYNWMDKYRSFTIFSLSGFSYKEMALMNIIFCYEQLGDNSSARKFHKKLAEEFPKNPYSLEKK